jgi:uncharacterized protein YjbJ (UPF0337 family)
MSRAEKGTGRAKKAVGEATGDRRLKREGAADKASGEVKRGIDRVRDLVSGRRRKPRR